MGTDLFVPLIFSQCIMSLNRKTLAGFSFLSGLFCEVKNLTWLLEDVGRNQEAASCSGLGPSPAMPLQVGHLGSGESVPGSSQWKASAVLCAAGVVAKPRLLHYT